MRAHFFIIVFTFQTFQIMKKLMNIFTKAKTEHPDATVLIRYYASSIYFIVGDDAEYLEAVSSKKSQLKIDGMKLMIIGMTEMVHVCHVLYEEHRVVVFYHDD